MKKIIKKEENGFIALRTWVVFIGGPMLTVMLFVFGAGTSYQFMKSEIAKNGFRIAIVEQTMTKIEIDFNDEIKSLKKDLKDTRELLIEVKALLPIAKKN